MKDIGNILKELLESAKSVYKKTNDPLYLLVLFVTQSILTFVLSKGAFYKAITKEKYEYPKKDVAEFGDTIIALGKAVIKGRDKILDALLETLSYAYEHNLLLSL